MIQRKQTIFLFLAFVTTIVCLCLPLGSIELQGMGVEPVLYNMALAQPDNNGVNYDFFYAPMAALLVLAAILEITAIFLYKNRKRQARLCAFAIVLVFLWLLLFMYYKYFDLTKMGELQQSVAAYLPFLSAVFDYLAIKGIRADERLVRAADRIR